MAAVFVGTALLMASYEASKEWLTTGSFTRWQADGVTVTLAATFAVLASFFALRCSRRMDSQLRQSAEALQSALHFNEEILMTAPIAMLVYRNDGQCVLANPAACELVGNPQSVLLGQNYLTNPSWQSSGLRGQAERALAKGSDGAFESHFVCTSGREVWAQTQFVRFQNHGVPHVLLMLRDIAETKRAIGALAAQEREFHSLADNVPDLMLRVDPSGRVLFVNKAFESALGLSASGLLGRTLEENFPDGRLTELAAILRQVAAGAESASIEQAVPGSDGETQIHLIRVVAEPGRDGAPESVLAVGRDITALKKAEDELHLAASVFRNSAEGVLITDDQANILSVNPAFTQITGYPETEAIGRKPNLLRSDRHNSDFYRRLWAALKDKGQWCGEIWNRRKNGEAYLEWLTINRIDDASGKPVRYVAVFHDITELRSKDESIRHLAFHDALTGLPNRTLFQERLAHAVYRSQREGERMSVTFIDLDGFKNINDSLGHEIGDLLLQEVANRIKARLRRGSDTVARLGGDEFVVLMEDLKEAEQCACLAGEIIEDISRPWEIGGHSIRMGASMGMAFYPEDGGSAQELMKHADTAMYVAKQEGKNTYRFFRSEMLARVNERLTLEEELRHAVDSGELVLYYQPKVRMEDGAVRGVEALVRWRHPTRGLVGPTKFIPLAEEMGLIVKLGKWVLEEACRQAAIWHRKGLQVPVAVNISALQITNSDLPEFVGRLIAEHGLPPTLLQIELTESVLMANDRESIATLEQLRAMGLIIAVDDFGTGYSSLSRLRRLPIDILKIDRSFVMNADRNEKDALVVSMIVGLAKTLELDIIAEGVESQGQADFLLSSGCSVCQGHYWAEAQPAERIDSMLAVSGRISPGTILNSKSDS